MQTHELYAYHRLKIAKQIARTRKKIRATIHTRSLAPLFTTSSTCTLSSCIVAVRRSSRRHPVWRPALRSFVLLTSDAVRIHAALVRSTTQTLGTLLKNSGIPISGPLCVRVCARASALLSSSPKIDRGHFHPHQLRYVYTHSLCWSPIVVVFDDSHLVSCA